MKRLLLILVCISLFMSAFGQSFVLKGIVSSADGELLPGVNVKIQGTTVGTITDIDGNFQLNVNKGAVLEFSYIGFKKQSIKVNSQQMLNVELAPDQTNLDEVVMEGVNGYLVPKQNEAELAAAMLKLMSVTKEQRLKMGHASKELVEKEFAMDEVMNKWYELYHKKY